MKGRRQPGLGTTLGSLFRTALDQLGSVREVVDRGTQLQRNWFDATLLQRKRKDALALLGEAVYRAAVAGQVERVADDPQFRRLVEDIDELDQRIEVAEQRAPAPGPSPRTTDRVRPGRGGGASEPRVWRPVAPWTAPDESAPGDAYPGEAPGRRRRPSRTGEVAVGDDPLDPHAYPDDYDALDGDAPPDGPDRSGQAAVVRAAPRRPLGPTPDELGDDFGHFIEGDDAVSAFPARAASHLARAYDERDDDDLEQYMHEDDVPDELAEPAEPAPRRRSRAAAAKRAKQSQKDS